MIKNIDIHALERMRRRFNRLYGPHQEQICLNRLVSMVGRYGVGLEGFSSQVGWDEKTAVLITYGNSVRNGDEVSLKVLKRFLEKHVTDSVNTVHILPFYPYSSDDGFSVIDYRAVHSALGKWRDIQEVGQHYRLMFDLVLNHVSRKSRWFADYVSDIAPWRNFFIEMDPDEDLSAVVRPRSLPLLTPVQTRHGARHLWTTFSADQMDLDFSNPDVLFEFFDILLFYIANGATIIRLDAIAYLWKQVGSSCIHLPQTHEVVKLMRELLGMIAPEVVLLTETNVPHEENISYFGDGDEAQMVYQFSLPPLLMHALQTGNAGYLTQWASALGNIPAGCTYFNFTASHDGVGVRPLQGIIPPEELDRLIARVKELGGYVSMKANSDGSESPYELNITYFDALGDDAATVSEQHIERFLCSQTIAMELKGVPAVYLHSLTATRNDQEGVEKTGRARSINRRQWEEQELEALLQDPSTHHARVFREYTRRLRIRGLHDVFHPDAEQQVLDLGPELFVVVRTQGDNRMFCMSNVTDQYKEVVTDEQLADLSSAGSAGDLLTGRRYMGERKVIDLQPYQTVWLQI